MLIKNAIHLLNALRNLYTISVDWNAENYCGLKIKWDYDRRVANISMPRYIHKALQSFKHPPPKAPEDAPHDYNKPIYGAKQQMVAEEDTTGKLNPDDILHVQCVVGTLLYYALAVDSTMLVALGDLAATQTKGTQHTLDALTKLFNYAASHLDAAVQFQKSDMILHIHSDGSYLSAPRAISRVGGYFFMGNNNKYPGETASNGVVHVLAKILKKCHGISGGGRSRWNI